MSMEVLLKSRLNLGIPRELDGIEHFDLLEIPDIPEQPDDIPYRVKGTDKITTLANTFYNNPILWFVIAAANGLELLPVDLVEGTVLRIPSPRYVSQEYFTDALSRLKGRNR